MGAVSVKVFGEENLVNKWKSKRL